MHKAALRCLKLSFTPPKAMLYAVKTDAVIKMNVPVQTITVSKAGTVGTLSPFHSYTHARA